MEQVLDAMSGSMIECQRTVDRWSQFHVGGTSEGIRALFGGNIFAAIRLHFPLPDIRVLLSAAGIGPADGSGRSGQGR